MRERGAAATVPGARVVYGTAPPPGRRRSALHFLADSDDPHALVRELLAPLAPGSVLILSHGTGDGVESDELAGSTGAYRCSTVTAAVRPHAEVLRFFEGTELVDPGLVPAPLWRPEEALPQDAERIAIYAGVGVKH